MASVAHLLYPPPTKTGWDEFSRHHAEHHEAIEKGIAEKFGIPSMGYTLYPADPKHLDLWLREHASAHARYEQLLNVPGQDLGNLDFSNQAAFDGWVNLNFISHLGASTRLGFSYV